MLDELLNLVTELNLWRLILIIDFTLRLMLKCFDV